MCSWNSANGHILASTEIALIFICKISRAKHDFLLCSNLKTEIFQSSLPAELPSKLGALLYFRSGLHKSNPEVWRKCVPLVDCRGLTLQVCVHFSALQHFHEYIYYRIDIHYRAAGSTAGKHCSPVAFSSRWKHYSATAAVALETWSLSLFYPHSSPLASLSALLLAIRIKPAAGLAVLKCSLQLNTFK